jgi:2,3-bisphosphoglycerate-independent phosphoglycerate mutase
VATVDLMLARLLRVVDALGGVALITADHGNADEMYEINKKTGQPKQNEDGSYQSKTSHTLNPVPLILYDNQTNGQLDLVRGNDFALSNVAATVVNLLGYEAPEIWDPTTLQVK